MGWPRPLARSKSHCTPSMSPVSVRSLFTTAMFGLGGHADVDERIAAAVLAPVAGGHAHHAGARGRCRRSRCRSPSRCRRRSSQRTVAVLEGGVPNPNAWSQIATTRVFPDGSLEVAVIEVDPRVDHADHHALAVDAREVGPRPALPGSPRSGARSGPASGSSVTAPRIEVTLASEATWSTEPIGTCAVEIHRGSCARAPRLRARHGCRPTTNTSSAPSSDTDARRSRRGVDRHAGAQAFECDTRAGSSLESPAIVDASAAAARATPAMTSTNRTNIRCCIMDTRGGNSEIAGIAEARSGRTARRSRPSVILADKDYAPHVELAGEVGPDRRREYSPAPTRPLPGDRPWLPSPSPRPSPLRKLYPTRNDLRESTRSQVAALLNRRLSDAIDLQTQCKQAHWNVKGPSFIALHKLFDDVYAAVDEYVDLLAERIVQLGGIAEGTARTVAERSRAGRVPARHRDGRGSRQSAERRDGRVRLAHPLRDQQRRTSSRTPTATDICTEISRGVDKVAVVRRGARAGARDGRRRDPAYRPGRRAAVPILESERPSAWLRSAVLFRLRRRVEEGQRLVQVHRERCAANCSRSASTSR